MSLSPHTRLLSEQVGALLLKKQLSITCAESCTGGGVGYAITATAGSSAWFERGFITYSNSAKQELLGVSADALAEFGAVSETVVEQMATGAAVAASADVAVAISGIAGPGGGSSLKPVGLVHFGFYVQGEIHSCHQIFSGDRDAVRDQAIDFTLSQLLQYLR